MEEVTTKTEYIIGCDEVGTGALAGPAVLTAVVYPRNWKGFQGLQDSKLYKTPSQKLERRRHADRIYDTCCMFLQKHLSNEEIDAFGLYPLLIKTYSDLIRGCLEVYPNAEAIVDGNLLLPGVPHLSIPKADRTVPAVSAASVLGKVDRDWWMCEYAAEKYPRYDFDKNVGYSSLVHQEALRLYGPCKIHRRSYLKL